MWIDLSNLSKKFKRFSGVKLISIILLLIMLGSTVTGYLLQALSTWGRNADQTEVELPDTNIIDYSLTGEQKDLLVGMGKTVMEYRHPLTCIGNCSFQKAYIESAVAEFSDQLFLQEIVDDAVAGRPTLELSSFYGRRMLTDPSQEEVLEALCRIMADPPVRCVTMGM